MRQSGKHSAELYGNLGGAYLRQKKLAQAILSFERGLLLAPNDAALRADLALAQKNANLEPTDAQLVLLARQWAAVCALASADTWAAGSLVLFWAMFAGIFVIWRGPSPRQRQLAKWAVLVLAPIFLLTIACALSNAKRLVDSQAGIILQNNASAFPAPDPSTDPLDQLAIGTKIGVLDHIGDWWKVCLPSGETAWVVQDGLEKI